jgi:hypothetical protein
MRICGFIALIAGIFTTVSPRIAVNPEALASEQPAADDQITPIFAALTMAGGLAMVIGGSIRAAQPSTERWRPTQLPERKAHENLSASARGRKSSLLGSPLTPPGSIRRTPSNRSARAPGERVSR